jgi:hypothetical protein
MTTGKSFNKGRTPPLSLHKNPVKEICLLLICHKNYREIFTDIIKGLQRNSLAKTQPCSSKENKNLSSGPLTQVEPLLTAQSNPHSIFYSSIYNKHPTQPSKIRALTLFSQNRKTVTKIDMCQFVS